MNDSHIVSITQIKEFIKVARDIEFKGASRQEKYTQNLTHQNLTHQNLTELSNTLIFDKNYLI